MFTCFHLNLRGLHISVYTYYIYFVYLVYPQRRSIHIFSTLLIIFFSLCVCMCFFLIFITKTNNGSLLYGKSFNCSRTKLIQTITICFCSFSFSFPLPPMYVAVVIIVALHDVLYFLFFSFFVAFLTAPYIARHHAAVHICR